MRVSTGYKRHYYKMWVQFTNPHSLTQWIHYFSTSPHLLKLMKSLKIYWNHLAYKDIFCCNEELILFGTPTMLWPLSKLKIGILVWPRVKTKNIPCGRNPWHGILVWACGQSLKYSIAIGLGIPMVHCVLNCYSIYGLRQRP